jgi:hypothetical protein
MLLKNKRGELQMEDKVKRSEETVSVEIPRWVVTHGTIRCNDKTGEYDTIPHVVDLSNVTWSDDLEKWVCDRIKVDNRSKNFCTTIKLDNGKTKEKRLYSQAEIWTMCESCEEIEGNLGLRIDATSLRPTSTRGRRKSNEEIALEYMMQNPEQAKEILKRMSSKK